MKLPSELENLLRRTVAASRLGDAEAEELATELRAHFQDGLAAGRSPEELAARFGDPDRTGARIAEVRAAPPTVDRRRRGRRGMGMSHVATDIRRAFRSLGRAPAFAALVVATLALGVGANTAVFTVLDAVLLEPLPYHEPDRLVQLFARWGEGDEGVSEYVRAPTVSHAGEWSDIFDGFASVYTYRETGRDLTVGDGAPERVVASYVSAGWFEMLGVPPMLGRTFRMEESRGAGEGARDDSPARVAILSEGLWRRRFEADPAVVGTTIDLGGEAWQVVGVMPAAFVNPLGSSADLWIPQDLREGGSNNWGNFFLTGIGRLAPGVDVEQAQERFDARWAGLVEANPDADGPIPELRPLVATVVGSRRTAMLWILAVAVALVLVSACVNVANLVFARSLSRGREVAVRAALGSDRPRLVTHLLAESTVLAFVGGAAGLLLGWVGVSALLRLAPDALPPVATPRLSPRVFLFSLVVTVAALLAFGLAPALRAARTAPADALRGGGRTGTEGRGLRRLRDGLVVAQVAVALVLSIGAGLLIRSFDRLLHVPLGIDTEPVLTFEVHLPDARFPDGASRHRFQTTFHDRIADLPAVESAGATSWLPVNGRYHSWGVQRAEDADQLDDDRWENSDMRVMAGDYFGALAIDLVQGEGPEAVDPDGEPVGWINRTMARRLFGDADPVGQRLFAGNAFRRIAGVVEDVPYDVRGDVSGKTYLLHAQFADNRNWPLIHVVRARPGSDLAALREEIRTELARLDPSLVLYRPRPLDALLDGRRAQDRFATTLMGVFAALALTLAAVGTYGVLAGTVARRRPEIGIRMALGAAPARVRGMVVRSAMTLVLLGLAIGGLGSWIAGRWLSTLLFEVAPNDPTVWASGVALLTLLGVLAGWVPALRATRVDPALTLGGE